MIPVTIFIARLERNTIANGKKQGYSMSKELSTLKDIPPTLIKLKNQRLQYYKDELDRLKGIEKQLSKEMVNINILTKQYAELRRKADFDRDQLDHALTELNLLRPIRTIIKYTLQCPALKKEINILECNRGIYLKMCGLNSCTVREKLYSDLRLVY